MWTGNSLNLLMKEFPIAEPTPSILDSDTCLPLHKKEYPCLCSVKCLASENLVSLQAVLSMSYLPRSLAECTSSLRLSSMRVRTFHVVTVIFSHFFIFQPLERRLLESGFQIRLRKLNYF